MKYICKECPKPCEIIVKNGSNTPMYCLYKFQWDAANWHKVDETLQENIQDMVTNTCQAMDKGKENVAKATCTFGNLPKLTAEVFDRPDCPEWAKYAAVDKDGKGFYYQNKPAKKENKKWSLFGVGDYQHIGIFDASDWHNILIERPSKLPDWCKVGVYVHDNKNGYGEVVSIRNDRTSCCISFFSKGCGDFVPGALAELKHINVRPYTDEEMKSLVGKILVNKETKDINLVTDYIHEVDEDDPDFHYCTVYVGGENMTAGDLLEDFTIADKPCGIIVEQK